MTRKIKCFVMMQFQGEHQNEIFEKIEETAVRINQTMEFKIIVNRADLGGPLTIE